MEQEVSVSKEGEEGGNEVVVVLVDLETSGFGMDPSCILQIAAKCAEKSFQRYINPGAKPISAEVTAVNNLKNVDGDLFYMGNKVVSVPLNAAIKEFLDWLASHEKKCCIATHSLGFDGPRLFAAVTHCKLHEEFAAVVEGFADTLKIIYSVTGKKGKGQCTITGLANVYNIESTGAHNAINDCAILQEILRKCKIQHRTIVANMVKFVDQTSYWELASMKDVGVNMKLRWKLVKGGITYSILKNTYLIGNEDEVRKLISSKTIRLQQASVDKIIKFCRTAFKQ